MLNHIFNEDGIKLGITDVVSYLSIQIDIENIEKVLFSNYYWDLFNRSMDVLIDEGFFNGKKYENSGTVEDTIAIIEEFYITHYDKTKEDIKQIRNNVIGVVSNEIEGFDSILLKINNVWTQ